MAELKANRATSTIYGHMPRGVSRVTHGVINLRPRPAPIAELPLAGIRPRSALGLSMPELMVCGCQGRILRRVFYDAMIDHLICQQCVHLMAPDWPGRFKAITIDARGLVPDVDHLPAGQAIAVLVKFGARTG